ncbi:transmembrane protein 169-like [Pomacea canaliculata]|uniref:transmembrane protein 169-like n=1 Tax=Pomacea canaliculata TaxID=400727 RepID=UPI000D732C92|nr:transmembrane protein 169-like [Pomacea canaliculata]XP_025080551.1 transmembrane protein 169-like [Pomacea canaliculata]
MQSPLDQEKAEWMELTRPLAKRRLPNQPGQQIVTVPGTIQHGNQAGQSVDIHLELSGAEFCRLTSRDTAAPGKCSCGTKQGPHITLLSVLFIPFSWVSSLCVAFYYGAMSWYNFYIYFSEEKTIWHKISICPFLILSFPLSVGLSAIGIALFACIIQLSWCFDTWLKEIRDFEKGFYAWFCNFVGLAQCSPYEIIILDEDGAFPDRS